MSAVIALAVFANVATANLLVNGDFEDPVLTGGDVFGAVGWTDFGGQTFTVHGPSNLGSVGAFEGTNAFKLFGGCCSGIFQQFPTTPGTVWNGGVQMLNYSGDQMSGGQVAAINIEWIQADGTSQSAITPFIGNGTFTAADAPVDEWTFQPITGPAPADAAFARLVLITGDFLPGGAGGAPFFDDAFLEVLVPEPGTVTMASLGLLGVFGVRRRRR